VSKPAWLQDPAMPSLVLFAALIAAGFGAIYFGWKVAAGTLTVPFQVPAVVSGGMGGVALVLTGAGLARIQVGRRLAAIERAATEALLDEARALVRELVAPERQR
jgi:hypothetical protein